MLPNGAALTADEAHEAPLRSPRDREITDLHCWERGGVALQDPTQGLDLYDWFIEADPETGAVYYSVPDTVAAVLFYTVSPLPLQLSGSFDTNMRPIVAWVDEAGEGYLRWYDPTLPGETNVALGTGVNAVKVALDDVRKPYPQLGVTDTILAYTRGGNLYYRQLRDRFETEYTLVTGGWPSIYQIGLNEQLRFQFMRTPGEYETVDFWYPFPDARAEYICKFDGSGNAELQAQGLWSLVPGRTGYEQSRTSYVSTSGHPLFLRAPLGTWPNTSYPLRVSAYRGPSQLELRAQRTYTFGVDARGGITRSLGAWSGEVDFQVLEHGAGTSAYSATFHTGGAGHTVSLTTLHHLPDMGTLAPVWHTSDMLSGAFTPTGTVRFDFDGLNLVMAAGASTTGRGRGTRMRWTAGSIPAGLCPPEQRSTVCTVVDAGQTVLGLAKVEADGSAEWWPATLEGSHFIAGAFAPTTHVVRTRGLPSVGTVAMYVGDRHPVPTYEWAYEDVDHPAMAVTAGEVDPEIAAAEWTPVEITTAAWFDADDAGTLSLSGSGVTAWADKSGNSYDVAQSSGSLRPLYVTGELNSKPILRFDGTADCLTTTTGLSGLLQNVSGAAMFAVVKWAAVPTSVRFISAVRTNGNFSRMDFGAHSTGEPRTGGRRLDADSHDYSASATNVTTAWDIQAGLLDYSDSRAEIWLNGVEAAENTGFQTDGNTSNTTSAGFLIGRTASATASSWFYGDLAELIVLNEYPSTDTRQKIEGYLAHKWGLTANLPGGHPYETGPPTV